ncbi:serine/threonine-protein kinase [Streptomyces sp. NPDC046197]|uniref:serine/threonine protein kinase n=1 Tax=Streptomyces sp. NPDC046197 TaxID=3154337 RepID=UPI0033D45EB7
MVKGHVSTHELVAGRYRLLDVVHRETNHVCWYGEDIEAERPRLLTQTVLPADAAEDGARRIPARIMRTTETMGLLRPGRVAKVVDAVVEAGTLWTVTEWIDGTPLGELLSQEGPFNYVRTARIGLDLLDVLEAAHTEGVTHGELSPGQVFVRDQGGVVVSGFGLAGTTLAPRITAFSYASPEQARNERIGPAADLWALGAILYGMVEGRPPFRERGRPEVTMKAVDRLPLRSPLRAGPLTQAVQGLLRKDSRERLTRPVVREALTRVLNEDPDTLATNASRPRLRGACAAACRAGRAWSRRTLVAGTTLAVVTVAVAILVATHQLPGTGTATSDTDRAAPSSGTAEHSPAPATGRTGAGTSRPPKKPPTTPPPSPSAPATGLPAGFRRLDAPEGFSVALPANWKRLRTTRAAPAYRVVFGATGDPRTLAVTYSERVGPDPVAVWRDDVEPDLERTTGYQRIGEIRATTYQGHRAADMEWLSGTGADRVHTFGRGFLLGDHRGFSLRWTTPAADFDTPGNRQALDVFLRSFRPASG